MRVRVGPLLLIAPLLFRRITVSKPSVLFVCQSNGGKSQMAAALARLHAQGDIDVYSAGTKPGTALNEESRTSCEAVGATFAGEQPKPVDSDLLRTVDRVVLVGSNAQLDPVDGMHGTIERWTVDEPSLRGIEGARRMDMIRDELNEKAKTLIDELRAP